MGILQVLSPNCFDGRDGYTPHWLIVHGTAGFTTAQDVAKYFATAAAQVSSHYVIGQDGAVIQCVNEESSAWGNGILDPGHDPWWVETVNPNYVTISIEHVKPHTDNSDVLTEAQKAASFALIEDICNRWDIPKREADALGGITGHFSLQPINRAMCPGPYPFDELYAYLNRNSQGGADMPLQLTDPFAKAFFQDQGGKGWYCTKTGKFIGGAIQTFYRQIQGAPRLPLTNELNDVPGIAYQIFECGIIIFDPDHKVDAPPGFDRCYLVKYSDALVQRYLVQPIKNQLAIAQAQITSLQQQIQQLQNQPVPPLTNIKIDDAISSVQAIIVALQNVLDDLGHHP